MELVYLWVKDYKNIHKQGFNFSPRFECEFDGENLNISENEDYVSIFPDNINITAIVGENGSGKSSVLQAIFSSLKEYFFIYQIKVKDETKLYYAKTENISVDFGNIEIEETKQSCGEKQDNSYNNFKTMFYNDNLFNDNLFHGTNEINPKTLIEDLFKSSKKDTPNFTQKLNNLMVKKILELLKRDDVKGLDLKYKSLYILVTFDRITAGDIENIFSPYRDYKYNDSYIIPYDELKNYEDIWNELDYKKIDFKISFKYEHNINETYPDSISISSMPSHGEMNFLFLLSSIYSTLKPIKYHFQNDYEEYFGNNIIIFLDEPMNYLHPKWQKNLIRNLINFLRANFQNINFHLILTTHSPFILSDIPKENVIFLEKYNEEDEEVKNENQKEGNCKNVTKDINIETFGANIHTLLSHGFFMENGLMGEFAKGKIEAIKEFYEMVKYLEPKNPKYKRILKVLYLYKIKKFKHIQSIIGEPFLKTIMKNYLDELELIFLDENDLIDIELKALEERKKYLEKLKNAKN